MSLNTYPYNSFPASTDKLDEAHNAELQQEIDTVKSGLTTLEDEVNGDATTYDFADVITIEDAVPSNLAGCTVKIEPVQSGSGDPSPTNIRPITGHTEASVQRVGRNLLPTLSAQTTVNGITYKTNSDGSITLNGTATNFSNIDLGRGALTLPAGQYTSSAKKNGIENVLFVTYKNTSPAQTITSVGSFTLTETTDIFFRIGVESGTKLTNVTVYPQIEAGDTATPYVPHEQTYTIALGSTIYGGTVDFDSGVMTVTMAQIASYDGETIGEPWISDRDVYAAGTTPTTGAQVVYTLATPTTIQLTPQQIQLLKGTNTLTASTGQISATVNGVSGSIGAVQEQVNATDVALAELVADIAEKLPTAPTTDGAYVLTVTVADGTPTYSWESAS